MKFGETFTEYLHGDQERFLDKCSHVPYKRLKKVLKSCRICRASASSSAAQDVDEEKSGGELSHCRCESCPLCDQMFFSELTKEASAIAGCFSSRVRHLLHLHVSTGLLRYMWRLRHCFTDDQQTMVKEGQLLIEYVTMNAIAIRKILKKYDKVHCSVNGRNFKTKMQAKHIELLQSPWLIELGAFYLNCRGSDDGESGQFFSKFSCDLSDTRSVMTLTLSDSVKLEYSLTCAICLDIVFNPYALSCGHLFCKGCVCSAASVLLFEGLKAAHPESKCPICRAVGVYADSVHMTELDLLLKNRLCSVKWAPKFR
ncbi:probable E3 ubiquitin-protein ligase BAH1-like 1 isoform X2 [Magnolia sinica]|uniref:probable E3 ubiquitin-protein ligase BAH1-like 1 isoform X2 n=1 Tax=Magnolia sinica TaxID=86752 RepID=UPI00265ABBB2|nr:probable E3 ubiquitin-protein ligase BAH1-like 1 isoform X2 [Magnolia sinica]